MFKLKSRERKVRYDYEIIFYHSCKNS